MSGHLDVVAAVIEAEGRILACRRRPEKSAGGKWEFPGGKVETGESRERALAREILEELGIQIEVGDLLTDDETVVDGRAIRLACYYARLAGPYPTASSDHDALQWTAPEDLASLDWAAPDWPAVRKLTAR